MTIEEIKQCKTELEERIAKLITNECAEFSNRIGHPITSIDLSWLDCRYLGEHGQVIMDYRLARIDIPLRIDI